MALPPFDPTFLVVTAGLGVACVAEEYKVAREVAPFKVCKIGSTMKLDDLLVIPVAGPVKKLPVNIGHIMCLMLHQCPIRY